MGRRTVAQFAHQIKRVLSPTALNDLGRRVGFCHRERLITPYRLVLGLLAGHATGTVETLADMQRQFNALFGTTVAYKPFHNQLAKRSFKDFMRAVLDVVLQQWVVSVLQPTARGPLGEFGRIVIQDGCSFAVKDALREHYPGRFKKQNPAAVELHVTMSVLNESVEQVTLTADTAPERPHLPSPEALRNDLLLADRGYFDREYLGAVDRAGGYFVMRASASVNPKVQGAYTWEGEALGEWSGQLLKQGILSKGETVDLDVVWGEGEKALELRLLARWNRDEGCHTLLVTNLARSRFSAEQVGQLYRLRWQVELLFKEWKSYANLHAFDTSKAGIAEGLVWTAIAASVLKRYLAQMTQVLRGVEVSTRKVAMCARHGLGDVFRALACGRRRGFLPVLRNLVDYLASNATRSHPKRDRKKGRLQFGLEPVL